MEMIIFAPYLLLAVNKTKLADLIGVKLVQINRIAIKIANVRVRYPNLFIYYSCKCDSTSIYATCLRVGR